MKLTTVDTAQKLIQVMLDQIHHTSVSLEKSASNYDYQLVFSDNNSEEQKYIFEFQSKEIIQRFSRIAQDYLLSYQLGNASNELEPASSVLSIWLLSLLVEGKFTPEIISIFSEMNRK